MGAEAGTGGAGAAGWVDIGVVGIGAPIINVAVGLLYTEDGFGGKGFLYTLWAIWWFDLFLSALSAFGVVHIMSVRIHKLP